MIAILLTFLLSFVSAIDNTSNPELSTRLKLSTTNLDRNAELPENSAWTFQFSDQKTYTFAPGSVVNANAATFPALRGVGMTLAMLNLGPCAMLTMHCHPRATNLVVAMTGNTTTWMYNENGARLVQTMLEPMRMTVFPRGSLHAMQNNGCDNAQLVSALDSEDAGTLTFANGLWQFPNDMLRAAFGYADIDYQALGKQIPDVGTGSVLGSEECLKRCGLDRKHYV